MTGSLQRGPYAAAHRRARRPERGRILQGGGLADYSTPPYFACITVRDSDRVEVRAKTSFLPRLASAGRAVMRGGDDDGGLYSAVQVVNPARLIAAPATRGLRGE